MFHLGPLLHAQNDPSCVIDEHAEFEYCDSREKIKVDFPSKEKARVLNVGCGTSSLSADMLYHGWADIVNVDYSEVVIEKSELMCGMECKISCERHCSSDTLHFVLMIQSERKVRE